MTSRAWITLIAFVAWSIGSLYWYNCRIKGYCSLEHTQVETDLIPVGDPTADDSPEAGRDTAVAEHVEELSFVWSSAVPRVSARWIPDLSRVLSMREAGKMLEIVGPYSTDEQNSSGELDLGIARARAILSILADSLEPESMLVKALPRAGAPPDSVFRLKDIGFRWITNNEQVKELADGALIYFPYKSDERINDPAINGYLDDLVEQMRLSENTIEIIGHTDDKGSAAYNLGLGQERADAIKALLVEKGVTPNLIVATSKGESEPLAPNTTEENKAKNRRTEIKIK